ASDQISAAEAAENDWPGLAGEFLPKHQVLLSIKRVVQQRGRPPGARQSHTVGLGSPLPPNNLSKALYQNHPYPSLRANDNVATASRFSTPCLHPPTPHCAPTNASAEAAENVTGLAAHY
ncbi:hypothetical protein THAOC_14114, partial [Thalassiosira oceanica]